ncbi:MAG: FliM/FliN family flagellar motor switch protein [Acidobacteria bacterium]|nr:FliM/FliN family flagellar motor switch protein [Acidobacteriota bacterium]
MAGTDVLPQPLDEIQHVADLVLDLEVELDRKSLSMRQMLELEAGSVVKLTRSAGENIDIVIGGTVVAYGEIVVIEDMMGVRITDFNLEG